MRDNSVEEGEGVHEGQFSRGRGKGGMRDNSVEEGGMRDKSVEEGGHEGQFSRGGRHKGQFSRGRGKGGMRDNSVQILFMSFLQETTVSSSGMGKKKWLQMYLSASFFCFVFLLIDVLTIYHCPFDYWLFLTSTINNASALLLL